MESHVTYTIVFSHLLESFNVESQESLTPGLTTISQYTSTPELPKKRRLDPAFLPFVILKFYFLKYLRLSSVTNTKHTFDLVTVEWYWEGVLPPSCIQYLSDPVPHGQCRSVVMVVWWAYSWDNQKRFPRYFYCPGVMRGDIWLDILFSQKICSDDLFILHAYYSNLILCFKIQLPGITFMWPLLTNSPHQLFSLQTS